MIITAQSHLDHGLSVAVLAHVLALFVKRSAFFIETIELPAGVPSVPCALFGPSVGDEPVAESEVSYARRGDRGGASRMVAALHRPSRLLTVIAGPAAGGPCVLYTAHGGPSAPREPWELEAEVATFQAQVKSLDEAGGGRDAAVAIVKLNKAREELAASVAFWAVHALATNHTPPKAVETWVLSVINNRGDRDYHVHQVKPGDRPEARVGMFSAGLFDSEAAAVEGGKAFLRGDI